MINRNRINVNQLIILKSYLLIANKIGRTPHAIIFTASHRTGNRNPIKGNSNQAFQSYLD